MMILDRLFQPKIKIKTKTKTTVTSSVMSEMSKTITELHGATLETFRDRGPRLAGLQIPYMVSRQFDPDESLHRQVMALPSFISDGSTFFESTPKAAHPTNCKNCGAALQSSKCEYCETRYA